MHRAVFFGAVAGLLVGYAVVSRELPVDVESHGCTDAPPSVSISRDERGFRADVIAPADERGGVPVRARLRRGTLHLWVTRTGERSCERRLVVRPHLVADRITGVVVETRDGVVVTGPGPR